MATRKRKTSKPKGADQALVKLMGNKYKEDMIISWHCSGGVLDGERLSREGLGRRLGVSEYLIMRLIEGIEKKFVKMFENQRIIRDRVFTMAATLMHQLREDRARAVLHNDRLDREIDKVSKMIDAAWEMSEATFTEHNRKRHALENLMAHQRALNGLRTESIRVMSQTSSAMNQFLSLFAGGKGRLPIEDLPDTETGVRYLDYTAAIRVIEAKADPILPRQDSNFPAPAGHNPNSGFEELERLRK